uniref:chitinase n=1 Tax=Timema poppense TaxID=170557 RepID=A0A7R9GYY2_TIMPO|nr:unnamed protein product [Timema poppensis]
MMWYSNPPFEISMSDISFRNAMEPHASTRLYAPVKEKMWLVYWAVLIAFAETSPRQLPFWGSQSFLRDSVERIPAHDTTLAEELHRSSNIREYVFGSRTLPLREAVESIPVLARYSALTSSERLPLRDAVEKRPDWDLPEVSLGYSASHLAPVVEKPGLAWWKKKMASQQHSIKSAPSHYYGNKVADWLVVYRLLLEAPLKTSCVVVEDCSMGKPVFKRLLSLWSPARPRRGEGGQLTWVVEGVEVLSGGGSDVKKGGDLWSTLSWRWSWIELHEERNEVRVKGRSSVKSHSESCGSGVEGKGNRNSAKSRGERCGSGVGESGNGGSAKSCGERCGAGVGLRGNKGSAKSRGEWCVSGVGGRGNRRFSLSPLLLQKRVKHRLDYDSMAIGSQKHKVVCFIEGWAVYRKEPMKFSTSKDLDPFACTHLIYAFATLDPHSFVIVPQDEDYDIVKGRYCTSGGYRSVLGMKRVNPSLKILISIGGWVEGTRKFSQMAGSAYNRREFIRSVLQFLDMYDFDGLDLDWEYPGAEDLGGRRTDKEHFSLLVEELSEVFAPRGWLLSASVSPSRFRLEDGYDVPRLNKHLDFINIMTFDLHAERDSAADHHSPLVQRKHDVGLNVFYNVVTLPSIHAQLIVCVKDYAVRYWMKKGASREKIIVGIPFYGRSFSLVNASMSWPSAPVKGFGLEGKYTQEQGFLAYFEVLELLEDNHWRKETDDVGSPYIVKGDQWIGYDNPDSIATKMSYIRKNMLGGAMGIQGLPCYIICLRRLTLRRAASTCPIVSEEDYKVMCYFTNWAWYRKGEGKFVPEHLDPRLCTHIVYAYASLDPNDLVIKPFDPWADIDNNFYQRITGTGRPGAGAVNVLLALGGWTDSSGDKYSRLVSNGSARRKFVTSVVAYLRRHNFRGLQLDWTYPKCWQSNCGKGPSSDKPNFTKLELKKEFKRNNPPLLLTASISGYKEVIDEAYDLPNIGRELDLLSVMTYDYHGSWERRVGHVSPLYYRQGDQFPQFNTNFTMEYLVSKGAPRKKLLVGIPFYGQSFTLESPQSYNQGAEARGPGAPGELTRQPGMLAYYEICDRWSLERDSFGATGPYAHSGDQWVGFEDVDSVKEKAKFIRNMGYGGAMAWTLDLDDFDNRCCREPYPLLRTINRVLGLSQESAPVTGDCTKPPAPVTPVPPVLTTGSDTGEWTPSITTTTTTTTTTTPRPTTTTRIPATSPPQPSEEPSESPGTCVAGQYYPDPSNCNAFYRCILGELRKEFCATGLHWNSQSKVCDWPSEAKCGKSYFKVVCYFTNWAWYRTGVGKYLPEDIDANLCTHIVYGFAVLDYENLIVKAHDSWADFDNKFYERVVAYKKKGLKVSLALGGWNDSAGDKYSRLVNSATARRKFVLQVVQFLDKYGFDGLDLDWEYPKCWQVDCDKGPDSDKASFAALVRELRQAFNPRGLLLSSAVSPSKTVIDAGYDVKTLGENLDWVAVMTYDFHGQWDKKTGHVAPLYFHEDDDFFFFNAGDNAACYFHQNYSINYWISEGVPRRKIVMGMPLYGQSFQLAQASTNGLNSRAPGPGQAGEFTRAAGFLAYYEICDRVKNRGWTVVKDPLDRMGPYAFKGNQWVSFDDAHMIRLKSEYIRDMDLGGGMVWALDLDDFRNRCGDGPHPLLNTIRSVLATPGTGAPGQPIY